jgi:hypothetical protein
MGARLLSLIGRRAARNIERIPAIRRGWRSLIG